jgi:hypothetical protein
MILSSLTIIWGALFAVVLCLAITRRWMARNEDDSLHLHQFDGAIVRRQSLVATLPNRLDTVGKSLTEVMVFYGIALIGRVTYLAWADSLQIQ